jgi:hypothetical protein
VDSKIFEEFKELLVYLQNIEKSSFNIEMLNAVMIPYMSRFNSEDNFFNSLIVSKQIFNFEILELLESLFYSLEENVFKLIVCVIISKIFSYLQIPDKYSFFITYIKNYLLFYYRKLYSTSYPVKSYSEHMLFYSLSGLFSILLNKSNWNIISLNENVILCILFSHKFDGDVGINEYIFLIFVELCSGSNKSVKEFIILLETLQLFSNVKSVIVKTLRSNRINWILKQTFSFSKKSENFFKILLELNIIPYILENISEIFGETEVFFFFILNKFYEI